MILRPQEGPQTDFLTRIDDEVLYGGAKGGGKSYALLLESLRQIEVPQYRALILRRTFPRLQELIDRSKDIFPKLGATYSSQEHTWTFPTGAKIRFGHCQNQGDERNFQGHEYAFIGFDQLEEFLESQYLFICAQNRSSTYGVRCYVRATANPGDVGHAWVKKRFIENKEPYKSYINTVEINGIKASRSTAFIPATVFDNKILLKNQPNYIATLYNLPEKERKALLEGNWDVFEGQYFSEFDRNIHVIKPFTPPKHWKRYVSGDYGYTAPSAIYWYAVDEAGTAYCYKELYKSGLTFSDLADEINRYSKDETIEHCVFDPAIWAKSGYTGETGSEILNNKGLSVIKADNNRLNGWVRVREYLQVKSATPSIYFTENCVNMIRTLPSLVYDKIKVEDVNTDGEDHAADSLRYFLMSRPSASTKIKLDPYREMSAMQRLVFESEDKIRNQPQFNNEAEYY